MSNAHGFEVYDHPKLLNILNQIISDRNKIQRLLPDIEKVLKK